MEDLVSAADRGSARAAARRHPVAPPGAQRARGARLAATSGTSICRQLRTAVAAALPCRRRRRRWRRRRRRRRLLANACKPYRWTDLQPCHARCPNCLQSSLRLSLGVRSVRTAPGQAAPADDLGRPTLAQEIYRKFAGKTQPESRQLVAILAAVQEVTRAQGLEPTPTAMFAALMAR